MVNFVYAQNFSGTVNLNTSYEEDSLLYSPELALNYHFHKDFYTNIGLGLWNSVDSNYINSDNGEMSNFQKLGLNYRFYKTNIKNKRKVILKNKKIKIIRTYYNQKSGYYLNINLIKAKFHNDNNEIGYSAKVFYEFQKSKLQLGFEHQNIKNENINFKLNVLSIGTRF